MTFEEQANTAKLLIQASSRLEQVVKKIFYFSFFGVDIAEAKQYICFYEQNHTRQSKVLVAACQRRRQVAISFCQYFQNQTLKRNLRHLSAGCVFYVKCEMFDVKCQESAVIRDNVSRA